MMDLFTPVAQLWQLGQQGEEHKLRHEEVQTLNAMRRQSMVTDALQQAAALAEVDPTAAQQFIDTNEPLKPLGIKLSQQAGALTADIPGVGTAIRVGGKWKIQPVTKAQLAVRGAGGDEQARRAVELMRPPQKPPSQRGLVVQTEEGPQVVGPEFRGMVGKPPWKAGMGPTYTKLEGLAFEKFTRLGREALTPQEQQIVDRRLSQNSMLATAARLILDDQRSAMDPPDKRAKKIIDLATEMDRAGRQMREPQKQAPQVSVTQQEYDALIQQGFTPEQLNASGIGVPAGRAGGP